MGQYNNRLASQIIRQFTLGIDTEFNFACIEILTNIFITLDTARRYRRTFGNTHTITFLAIEVGVKLHQRQSKPGRGGQIPTASKTGKISIIQFFLNQGTLTVGGVLKSNIATGEAAEIQAGVVIGFAPAIRYGNASFKCTEIIYVIAPDGFPTNRRRRINTQHDIGHDTLTL